jgi:AcrR family transcriptional regulator
VRADGVRNRRKVLDAATAAFATEGLSVPVAEIARRAGVGTGTVSRHFPTKEALYEAIVLERVEDLVARAGQLRSAGEPAAAFFGYLAYLADVAAANRGLAEALAGAGFDVGAAAARGGQDLEGMEAALLADAQAAGAVRPDVTPADVKALIVACVAREAAGTDEAGRRRIVEIIAAGLRALDNNS